MTAPTCGRRSSAWPGARWSPTDPLDSPAHRSTRRTCDWNLIMATLLYRLGRASFRRRGLVVIAWLVVLAALGMSAAAFKGATSSDFTMPGTESQRAIDALKSEFPEASGATGAIV